MNAVPDGANLGLGCGNLLAHAAIHEGDTVLDLGSGAGFDCFLAARKVGKTGLVIGVDMTPEMLAKARENAKTAGVTNVEFRLGEIEALPVADTSVEAETSCVAGAILKDSYIDLIRKANLTDVAVLEEVRVPFDLSATDPLFPKVEGSIRSVKVRAEKR